ncbi:MAG: hypothetical protein HY751_06360 [Nitrospinae bacterium]|nr:hypothetical protein [Nitrospinota bacterium]
MKPEIRVNDQTVELDLSGVNDLVGIVETLRDNQLAAGELMVELTVDGQTVDISSLRTEGNRSLDGVKAISLTTMKKPLEMAARLLREMGGYLGSLSNGVGKIADGFRMGNEDDGNLMLVDALDGIHAFVELIDTVKTLSKTDLAGISIGSGTVAEKEEKLTSVLRQLQEGQVTKDWVMVADLLEYEMAPLIDEWREILPLVEKELLKSDN